MWVIRTLDYHFRCIRKKKTDLFIRFELIENNRIVIGLAYVVLLVAMELVVEMLPVSVKRCR